MSVNIDSINRRVELVGGLGDTQGAYYTLQAPGANVIGLRLAYRPYLDSFMAGAIAPWSRQASSNDFYYASSTWDGTAAIGMSFDTVFPYYDGSKQNGFGTVRGFIGVRTGGAADLSSAARSSVLYSEDAEALLGNLAAIGSLGGYGSLGSIYGQYKGFWCKPTNSASSNFGVTQFLQSGYYKWSHTKLAGLYNLPANPTEGAKWTVGIEIRKNPGTYGVYQTTFYNTNSLAEANLLDVFTSYDDYATAFQVSRSVNSIDSEDAFYEAGVFTLPRYFMIRWGGPSQKLIVSALRYQYLYT